MWAVAELLNCGQLAVGKNQATIRVLCAVVLFGCLVQQAKRIRLGLIAQRMIKYCTKSSAKSVGKSENYMYG